MSALSIRNLDDLVTTLLRERAKRHGRSLEAEVRQILTEAVGPPRRARPEIERYVSGVDREDLRRAIVPAKRGGRPRPRPRPVRLDGPPLSDTVIEDRR